jgi:hypothetical protein
VQASKLGRRNSVHGVVAQIHILYPEGDLQLDLPVALWLTEE